MFVLIHMFNSLPLYLISYLFVCFFQATNESKITLTQYLAILMERDFPPAAKLDSKFPSLSDALRLSFAELTQDLDKLLARLGDVNEIDCLLF
jgi:hypothetical protein